MNSLMNQEVSSSLNHTFHKGSPVWPSIAKQHCLHLQPKLQNTAICTFDSNSNTKPFADLTQTAKRHHLQHIWPRQLICSRWAHHKSGQISFLRHVRDLVKPVHTRLVAMRRRALRGVFRLPFVRGGDFLEHEKKDMPQEYSLTISSIRTHGWHTKMKDSSSSSSCTQKKWSHGTHRTQTKKLTAATTYKLTTSSCWGWEAGTTDWTHTCSTQWK